MNDRLFAVAALIALRGLRRSIALTFLFAGLVAVQTGTALANCPDPERPPVEEDGIVKRLNYYAPGGYYCSAGPDTNLLGLPAGPYLCGTSGQFEPALQYSHACPSSGMQRALSGQPSGPSASSAPPPGVGAAPAPQLPPATDSATTFAQLRAEHDRRFGSVPPAVMAACAQDPARSACTESCYNRFPVGNMMPGGTIIPTAPEMIAANGQCIMECTQSCIARTDAQTAAAPPASGGETAAGAECIPTGTSEGYVVCRADRQQQQSCRGEQRPDCDKWTSLTAAPGEACWPDHQGRKIFWCPPASFEIHRGFVQR